MNNINILNIYKGCLAKTEESLYNHTRKVLEKLDILIRYDYIKDNTLKELIYLSCKLHDIGKLNLYFQDRIKKKKRFNPKIEIGHNILSAYLVNLFLDNLDMEKKLIIKNSILNHHKYVENYTIINNNKELIETNLKQINKEYFQIEDSKFNEILINQMKTRKINKMKSLRGKKEYILTIGFLLKCDYSASANIEIEIKNDFLNERLDLLNYKWNNTQKYCKENTNENLIITASTGIGKTEASLLWAGNNKVFYVLPLKTAINAMYSRLRDNLVSKDYQDKLGLLHNEVANVYLEDKSLDDRENFYDYYNLSRSMSLPITITTPDQLFNFVFKYSSYELKLATFSYSRIIIDEIQAYSPDILAYTIYAIQEIYRIGGKFAIFTATLAPFIKDLLNHKVNIDYKEKGFLSEQIRHSLKIENQRINSEFIYNIYKNERNKRYKKILVVMNTVKDAQEIYMELKNIIDKNNVEIKLLHSRFTTKDRREKELEIINDAKKRYNDKDVIWISTKIVEASLDIDFDILFTELSELMGLFQRMGRCYRNRDFNKEGHNIYVFTEIRKELLTIGDRGFIDNGLYNLSKLALEEKGNGIISEKDKEEMINKYLTLDNIRKTKNSNFLDEYKRKYNKIKNLNFDELSISEVKKEFRNIISYKAIPKSLYINNKEIVNPNITKILNKLSNKKRLIKNSNDLKEKELLRLDLIRLKNDLNEYIINIDQGYLKYCKEKLDLSYENIYICEARYTNEIGLERRRG